MASANDNVDNHMVEMLQWLETRVSTMETKIEVMNQASPHGFGVSGVESSWRRQDGESRFERGGNYVKNLILEFTTFDGSVDSEE